MWCEGFEGRRGVSPRSAPTGDVGGEHCHGCGKVTRSQTQRQFESSRSAGWRVEVCCDTHIDVSHDEEPLVWPKIGRDVVARTEMSVT